MYTAKMDPKKGRTLYVTKLAYAFHHDCNNFVNSSLLELMLNFLLASVIVD